MKTFPWLVVFAVFGLSGGVAPAWANASLEAPTSVSMTEAFQVNPHSADHLNDLAESIQRRLPLADGSVPAAPFDPRQVPLMGDWLDEEGNLKLPLGLRIYNTMGDASVGFGSTF